MKALDIIIVGVGGQGTLLASRILGQIAIASGLDVKVSEVHGMAQRGGSVITHVRMGEQVHAPLIEPGTADAVVAFELLEALRALLFLKPGGALVANRQRILPMPVILGNASYPDMIGERLAAVDGEVVTLDALKLALDCGNARAANVVLLGALAKRLPFPLEVWKGALKLCVPEKLLAVNLSALEAGYASEPDTL